jgi:hypothetical protein
VKRVVTILEDGEDAEEGKKAVKGNLGRAKKAKFLMRMVSQLNRGGRLFLKPRFRHLRSLEILTEVEEEIAVVPVTTVVATVGEERKTE